MLPPFLIIAASFAYLGLLFAIAYWGDKRADARRSLVNNPYIYALSIAVYCTSWTFYGSVGRAASTGIGFLPIYLGPTLVFTLGWIVLRKIVAISKANHITSIADFISSRYGKSHLLGGLVTVIAVVGIMPYISLQLKAVSATFDVLMQAGGGGMLGGEGHFLGDSAFYVAVFLAAFAILFGTRHIDATEHHEGMVAAIAFESVVKLVAFLAVGIFVTFVLFAGPGELFRQANGEWRIAELIGTTKSPPSSWVTLTVLAAAAILCLPRQFQVLVVENTDQNHLAKASWLFPLYLLIINLFVLPITFGGLLTFGPGKIDADLFVLALPLEGGHPWLALVVFLGGLSAATGMVIVETIALSTMLCNDLAMPLLLRFAQLHLTERRDMIGLMLGIRRISIVLVVAMGYVYFRLIGESYALVTIGLVSFAAAAQFAPVIIGGIYWKGGTRLGALAGLALGFVVWAYTLLLPSFARSGWLPAEFIEHGAFGLALLKPYALFGLGGFDPITHAVFWSLLVNVGGYVSVSLLSRATPTERIQATLFVEIFRQTGAAEAGHLWRGRAQIGELMDLASRFIGVERAAAAFAAYARNRSLSLDRDVVADAGLVTHTERLLAGVMGAASARVLLASAVKGEGVTAEDMLEILDEATQVIEYSRELERKSKALERAHAELKAANQQLQELDRLKDEFLSTVTHELRTPLTSIRSFSEILHDSPEIDGDQRQHFLAIIIKESERLTRLINNVLDLAKIESGRLEWQMSEVDLRDVVNDSVEALASLFAESRVAITARIPDRLAKLRADPDRLQQVVMNLLSNAVKVYRDAAGGAVEIDLVLRPKHMTLTVIDHGPGIADSEKAKVFDRFYQIGGTTGGNPTGSGLGLAICQRIIEHLDGRIWVEDTPGGGASFVIMLPRLD